MIRIKLNNGLANRMRTINSAVALSQEFNQELEIIWVKNSGLNAKFCDLFEPLCRANIRLNEPRLSYHNLPIYFDNSLFSKTAQMIIRIFNKNLIYAKDIVKEQKNLEKICKDGVYICSCHAFYPADFDVSLFKPKEHIEKRINKIAEKFSENVYGFHIRRTDNKKSIEFSPQIVFEEKIGHILDDDNTATIFLATDSEDVKQTLIKKFGDRIITNIFDVSRSNLAGIENAVVDMYLLSKTNIVYGSYWSSFSNISAQIAGKPFEVLKK